MPNHVKNILTFSGDEKRIEILRSTIKGKFEDGTDSQIDFNNIIPRPESLNITSGSSTDYGIAIILFREENNPQLLLPVLEYPWAKADGLITPEALANHLVEKGMANLKEGRIAYENEKKYGYKDWYSWSCANWGTKWNAYSQENLEPYKISFDTAWSSPFPVIEKLSKMFPEIEITLEFADEDFGQNCGQVTFLNGNPIKENFPEGGSMEAILLAGEIQGMGPGEYVEYFGETESKEWAEKIIEVVLQKFSHDTFVGYAVAYKYISLNFLKVLKTKLVEVESYELVGTVESKIKAMEEGEN